MWHSCLKKSPCFLDFVTAKTSPVKMPKYFTRWKEPKHFWSFRVKTLTIQRLTKLVFKRTNPFATFLFRFLNNSVATFIRKTKHFLYTWASEGGQGELPPRILKILAKKVVFLVSSGKKQILPLLDPLQKFWKNSLVPPLEKILPTLMHLYNGRLHFTHLQVAQASCEKIVFVQSTIIL